MADEPTSLLGSSRITRREAEVLAALRDHLTNAEIAARLVVSERTVESHVSSLLRKLQVGNRRALARIAAARLLGDDASTNLPLPTTSFIGREDARHAIGEAVDGSRLVTLTGPGGVGKTRLAVEVAAGAAAQFPGGVWFVDLASVASVALVPRAVADVLALDLQPDGDLPATIAEAMAHRAPTLLILDNCEHVVDAAAAVAQAVIVRTDRARLLATSRQVLGVPGERVVTVTPLSEREAGELFVDRARLAGPSIVGDQDTEAIAAICRQLDHLPLAIELAATQLRVLEPAQLASRLDDLSTLSRPRSLESRHGSIAAAAAWSYDNLTDRSKRVFELLSVFAGSCAIDAAEAVCSTILGTADGALAAIGDLVDRSMVMREQGRTSVARYRILETLRLYGLDRLAATGGAELARRAHAEHYLRLSEASGRHLFGPDEVAWMTSLRAELPNLRAALAWARDHDRALALRFGPALRHFWTEAFLQGEGIEHLRGLLEDGSRADERDASLEAWALTTAADLSSQNRDPGAAIEWAQAAIDSFVSSGDERGVAHARLALGWALDSSGELEQAATALDAAIDAAGRLGDRVLLGLALDGRGHVAALRGDHEEALRWYRRELATWAEMGSRRQQAWCHFQLAHSARSSGDLDAASALADRALAVFGDDDPPAAAHVRSTLGDIARLQGRVDDATRIYEGALATFLAVGDRRCAASAYKNLGQLAHARGDDQEAADLFVTSMQVRNRLGDRLGVAECLAGMAAVGAAVGRTAEAVTLLAAAAARRDQLDGGIATEDHEASRAILEAATDALGLEGFEAAWARGTGLDDDDAVAWAEALPPWHPS